MWALSYKTCEKQQQNEMMELERRKLEAEVVNEESNTQETGR